MERFPLIGNYIHVHKGERKATAKVILTDIYNGMLAQEANTQASFPGTGIVICGDTTRKVAKQGVTRKVTITDFDIHHLSDRSYTDGDGRSHWDFVAVVGYYGDIRAYPEGAQAIEAEPAGISLEEFKFSVSVKVAGPIVIVDVKGES